MLSIWTLTVEFALYLAVPLIVWSARLSKVATLAAIALIAVAATGWTGSEGKILRFVFPAAVFWGVLVGLLVMLQAYVIPWTVPLLPGM